MKTKSIATNLAAITFLVLCFSISGCKDDPNSEPSPEESFLTQIAGTWTLTSASLDQKDVTASFPQLIVTISADQRITVTNAVPPVWMASETFDLRAAGNTFSVLREGGVEMTISQPTANQLIIRFVYDAEAMGGRNNSVSGEFTFEFVRV